MVPEKLTFTPLSRRQIEADFSGGHITSDAGLLLLREDDTLAGKSTLCRMEQRVDRQSVVKAHELLWHHFIEQHDEPTREIVLDFATPGGYEC